MKNVHPPGSPRASDRQTDGSHHSQTALTLLLDHFKLGFIYRRKSERESLKPDVSHLDPWNRRAAPRQRCSLAPAVCCGVTEGQRGRQQPHASRLTACRRRTGLPTDINRAFFWFDHLVLQACILYPQIILKSTLHSLCAHIKHDLVHIVNAQ